MRRCGWSVNGPIADLYRLACEPHCATIKQLRRGHVMEPQWLTFGKQLQAIASTGLHFAQDPFDRDRYEEVARIANEMLASLGNVPIERIEGLVSDFARGYATPKVDVRGALIEGDTILLVRERSDRLWTLPGGFADVGLSPARNVEKEIFEEAGLKVSARRLYGVRHKAGSGYSPDVRDGPAAQAAQASMPARNAVLHEVPHTQPSRARHGRIRPAQPDRR